jgi:transposase
MTCARYADIGITRTCCASWKRSPTSPATADRARAGGGERIDADVGARLEARYQRLLADGLAANPLPPARGRRLGRARRSPAGRLLERLDGHCDEVLLFLDEFRVPFTNNQAERDLRMVKLQQRSPGAGAPWPGAAAFLALRSCVSTARKQGLNPVVVLWQLFEGRPWLPAPAPGPLLAPP